MRALVCGVLCLLVAPAAASAAPLDFDPCPGTPDFECAALDVPLGPSSGSGSLRLGVRRLIETREAPSVLVALAGGPGQSSTRFIGDFADVLAEGLENRQLVVLDTRGTGDSGALRCAALRRLPTSVRAMVPRVGRCGAELGARRQFFTTTEVVEDVEALRRALEVERISLYGVSYGSYVAQRYARRYPGSVDRLVLDSPVAQDQGGAFDRSSYRAVGPALRRVGGSVRDLRRLLARLPLRARVYDARGRGRRLALSGQAELFDLLVSSDLSPPLRDGLPGAIRSAVRGDPAPLVRLLALDLGTADPRQVDAENEAVEEFSNALFFATTCQEKPLPWGSPTVPPDQRAARRAAAVAGLGGLGPFGRPALASTQVGTAFCARWPATSIAPVPAPGPIGAPALVLSGMTDLRTPPVEALRTAALIPDASLVRVPGAGHSLLSGRIACVQTSLRRFFADRAVGNPCAGEPPAAVAPDPAPVAPVRLRDVSLRGVRGRGARVVAGALATVEDAARTAAGAGLLDAPYGFGGLRGGRVCARPGPAAPSGRRPLVLDLRRVRHVRGLAVGGRATIAGDRIAALRLRIRGGRRLVLRGRRIGRVRLSPARLTVPRPDVAASLAAGAGQRCR